MAAPYTKPLAPASPTKPQPKPPTTLREWGARPEQATVEQIPAPVGACECGGVPWWLVLVAGFAGAALTSGSNSRR